MLLASALLFAALLAACGGGGGASRLLGRRRRRRRRRTSRKAAVRRSCSRRRRLSFKQTRPQAFPKPGTTEYEASRLRSMNAARPAGRARAEGRVARDQGHRQASHEAARPDQEAVLRRQRDEVPGGAEEAEAHRRSRCATDPAAADREALFGQRDQGRHRLGQRGARLLPRSTRRTTRSRSRATCATSSSSRSRSPIALRAAQGRRRPRPGARSRRSTRRTRARRTSCGKVTVSKGQTVPEFDKVALHGADQQGRTRRSTTRSTAGS